jgi:hypothetical protein
LVEALALDSERVIVPSGSSTIAAGAAAWGTPVWLVAGVGRRLPSQFVDAMIARRDAIVADRDEWAVDVDVLPTSMVTHVVGPRGVMPMGPPAARAECPFAAELLRHAAM